VPGEVTVATCVWRCTAELLLALDDRFGEPVDSYVNGSQVWLRDDGPSGVALEWRLHPVAGFQRPAGAGTYDLLEQVVFALRTGAAPPAHPTALWDGLEAFPAYGDDVEPAPLASACTAALGIEPDAYGMVDHERIGDEWERTGGRTSVVAALLSQLGTPPA
jgi:hypothetical protein